MAKKDKKGKNEKKPNKNDKLAKKELKMSKKKNDEKPIENDSDNTHSFSAPKLPPLPPFLREFVRRLQREAGTQFQMVNVRIVGEDELDELPKELLDQILEKAVDDENFELAVKVRDAINKK